MALVQRRADDAAAAGVADAEAVKAGLVDGGDVTVVTAMTRVTRVT